MIMFREAQQLGIWAWDAAQDELVLVFPSVLSLLGDNPMQSELACHIGLRGKFFCRCCWVKGKDTDTSPVSGGTQLAQQHIGSESELSSVDQSRIHSEGSVEGSLHGSPATQASKTGRGQETLQQIVDRAKRFIGVRLHHFLPCPWSSLILSANNMERKGRQHHKAEIYLSDGQ